METVANSRYDLVSVWIHWITAALLIFMLIFGEELMETGEGVEGVGEAGEAGEALASTFEHPCMSVSEQQFSVCPCCGWSGGLPIRPRPTRSA